MIPDRHGRSGRADNDGRRRPPDGFRTRDARRFRRVVDDAVAALPQRLAQPMTGATIVVADVPPPPMVDGDGDVVLATYGERRLTVYRRPVEARADSRATLEETLLHAIARAVADATGFDGDIDDLLG